MRRLAFRVVARTPSIQAGWIKAANAVRNALSPRSTRSLADGNHVQFEGSAAFLGDAIVARNVAAMTVDVKRAKVSCDTALTIATDGPLTLQGCRCAIRHDPARRTPMSPVTPCKHAGSPEKRARRGRRQRGHQRAGPDFAAGPAAG
jgi:hypothetical protein